MEWEKKSAGKKWLAEILLGIIKNCIIGSESIIIILITNDNKKFIIDLKLEELVELSK